MRIARLFSIIIPLFLVAVMVLATPTASEAQIGVGISIGIAPPILPIYVQPPIPAPGYMFTPGYWAYGPDGYYWVPGTWVQPPTVGFLWTPGYWGWRGGGYFWNGGYWGPHVGFYGGINYGFGYFGVGFGGGYWNGGHYFYNRAYNPGVVNNVHITNVYNKTVVVNNSSHVAYNGGQGGITARPTAQEESYAHEQHVPPTSVQTQHAEMARSNPELRASENHGNPPIAATAKPADFKSGVVPARGATPVRAEANRPAAETHGTAAHPAEHPNNMAHPNTMAHPTEHPNNMAHPSNMAHPNTSHATPPAHETTPHTFTPRTAPPAHEATPHTQARPQPAPQHQAAPRPESRPPQHEAAPRPESRPPQREAAPRPESRPESHPEEGKRPPR